MDVLIITNNPKVEAEFTNNRFVKRMDCDFGMDQMEVLRRARDLVHLGAKLVAHPMMGRIKPHETPYKTVILFESDGTLMSSEMDMDSFMVIEDSLSETSKFLEGGMKTKYDDAMLSDLQFMDYVLTKTVMDEIGNNEI